MSTSIITFPVAGRPRRDDLDRDQLIVRAFFLAHDIADVGAAILPHRPDLTTLAALVLRDWARAAAEASASGAGTTRQ
jgi:hypothetical protein